MLRDAGGETVLDLFAVKVFAELMHDVDLGRSRLVFVEWIPADAHDRFVNLVTFDPRPAGVDSCPPGMTRECS